jgi:hypothetical protein
MKAKVLSALPLLLLTVCGSRGVAFADNCAAMEDSGPEWFAGELGKAGAAQASRDSTRAYDTLQAAMMGVPRKADVSLWGRCVGLRLWQQFYDQRREVTRALGQQAEQSGPGDQVRNAMDALNYYVEGHNRQDASRVIGVLTPSASGSGRAIGRLKSEIDALDFTAAQGFELLSDEQSARQFWQQGLDDLAANAQQQAANLLDLEEGLVTGEATSEELQIEAAQTDAQDVLAQFLGDESLAPGDEAMRDISRARGSLRMLERAREWVAPVSAGAVQPLLARALSRGDALMAKAGDAALSLEARDSLYESAGSYFDFAGDDGRRQAAARGRDALAPALKGERDQREARLDQKSSELEAAARQAQQQMQKTEAEKQSFKEEADALEDELGF